MSNIDELFNRSKDGLSSDPVLRVSAMTELVEKFDQVVQLLHERIVRLEQITAPQKDDDSEKARFACLLVRNEHSLRFVQANPELGRAVADVLTEHLYAREQYAQAYPGEGPPGESAATVRSQTQGEAPIP